MTGGPWEREGNRRRCRKKRACEEKDFNNQDQKQG